MAIVRTKPCPFIVPPPSRSGGSTPIQEEDCQDLGTCETPSPRGGEDGQTPFGEVFPDGDVDNGSTPFGEVEPDGDVDTGKSFEEKLDEQYKQAERERGKCYNEESQVLYDCNEVPNASDYKNVPPTPSGSAINPGTLDLINERGPDLRGETVFTPITELQLNDTGIVVLEEIKQLQDSGLNPKNTTEQTVKTEDNKSGSTVKEEIVIPTPNIKKFSSSLNTVTAGSKVDLSYEVTDVKNIEVKNDEGEIIHTSKNGTSSFTTPALRKDSGFILTALNGDKVSTKALAVQVIVPKNEAPKSSDFSSSSRAGAAAGRADKRLSSLK